MKKRKNKDRTPLPDGQHNITGANIRIIRNQKNLTQAQLAERLRQQGVLIDQKTISAIEIGVRSVFDYEMIAFANVLCVSIDALYMPVSVSVRRKIVPCVDVAENVAVLMKQKGMAIKRTAEKCGVSSQTIKRIIDGEKNVTLETLEKVANGLGVDVADLYKTPSTTP